MPKRVTPMKPPTASVVLKQMTTFYTLLAIAAGAFVLVHLLPKPAAARDPLRLTYTIGFFASAVMMCWSLTEPRSRYLHALYAWRFEDAPQSLDRCWRRYLHATDRLAYFLAYPAAAFMGSTGLFVLSQWFYGLTAMLGLARWVWWISAIALVFFPMVGSPVIAEVFQRRRQLFEQISLTTWFRPRTLNELTLKRPGIHREPVVRVTGDLSFRAGGSAWTWEDFTKNSIVFGQSGSGKTACVLNALLDGLLSSAQGRGERPAGLILDPKGDFRGKLQRLCARLGRESDLLVLSPQTPHRSIRWNPFDSADDELELAARFAATLEALGMKNDDTSYWVDSAKKFIRHGIALIRLTNPRGMPPSFQQIAELAVNFENIVARTDRLDVTRADCDGCLNYFANEWCDLAAETRTSVQSYLTNMLDPFQMEPYATMFSGHSTMRLADMLDSGKILYVDMPIADKELMARTVGTFIKLEYFREVLRRPDKLRPSFFLCDEFQSFFTTAQGKGDSDFFERSRQSQHANVIATQNLPALLKASPKKETVQNLLGNCAVKLFLRNTDHETNEYASKLFGQQLVTMSGGGAAGSGQGFLKNQFSVFGGAMTASESEQYDNVVRPERFTELAIPARGSAVDYCEVIPHHAARPELERAPRKQRWRLHLLDATEPRPIEPLELVPAFAT